MSLESKHLAIGSLREHRANRQLAPACEIATHPMVVWHKESDHNKQNYFMKFIIANIKV